MTWPRIPCGRATRPTTKSSLAIVLRCWCFRAASQLLLIAELERRLDSLDLRGCADQRSHRRGGPPLAADDAPELARRHEQLDERLARDARAR